MARTAVTELQQGIEEARREAFAAGYAAAMQAIRDLATRPVPSPVGAAASTRRGAGPGRGTTTRSRTIAATGRRVGAGEGTTRRRRPAARPERGANAQRVEEVLKTSAPHALRMAEIRKALQKKGTEISFTSLRHALSQLEARNAAEQIGRTWRYAGGTS